MGRPIKIAKAHAVVTITNTTASTNIITTSANFTNLGIIAGMPFVTATTLGGLTAGTTYWVLKVVNSGNNSTFLASETPPNANPNSTPKSVTTASSSVVTTIAPVDLGFNNPASGTYGVVGGDTTIFGNQIVANVAIGVKGNGTVYAGTTSNVVSSSTGLASIGSGSVIETTDGNGNKVVLGYAASVGNTTSVATSGTTTSVITTTGNASTLTANLPVSFSDPIGGLASGQTYFVKTVANATAFTVSSNPGGANLTLAAGNVVTTAVQGTVTLTANAAANISEQPFVYATPEAGFIVRQKGKQKYLVKGTTTGRVGSCYTANLANSALLPNTMTMTATYANTTAQKIQSVTNRSVDLFNANSGVSATGTSAITAATPAYATFGSAANANIANGIMQPIVTVTKS